MPALVHNLGLELPVFDGPVTDTKRIGQLDPWSTFVRNARIRAVGETSLTRVLAIADEIFEMTASACGAKVIDHVWGLHRSEPREERYWNQDEARHIDLLPDGYKLVAELPVLESTTEPEPHQRWAIRLAGREAEDVEGFYWNDISQSQFTNGIGPQDVIAGLWLTDIEPNLI